MRKIFGGRKEDEMEKREKSSSWMGEESKTQWNPIGRYGKRLKCMNCLSKNISLRIARKKEDVM